MTLLEFNKYNVLNEAESKNEHGTTTPALRSGMIGTQVHSHLEEPEQVCCLGL